MSSLMALGGCNETIIIRKTDLMYFFPCRWTFLETGVDGIMKNLGEGLDMAAVSVTSECAAATVLNEDLQYMGIYTHVLM